TIYGRARRPWRAHATRRPPQLRWFAPVRSRDGVSRRNAAGVRRLQTRPQDADTETRPSTGAPMQQSVCALAVVTALSFAPPAAAQTEDVLRTALDGKR